MRSGLVVVTTAVLLPILAGCGSTAASAQHGAAVGTLSAGSGRTQAHASKDPTALDPCSFVTADDLKAALRPVYGAAVDAAPSVPTASPTPADSTPSDAAPGDTASPSDPPTPAASSMTNFQVSVTPAPNSAPAPGFSRQECDLTARADQAGGVTGTVVFRLVVSFVTADSYQSAASDGWTTASISGADGAIRQNDNQLVQKNGWVVAATGMSQGTSAVLTAMLQRLPA